MKKFCFTLLLITLPLLVNAQNLKFGYFSYDKVFHAMASYATASNTYASIKAKYDAEVKRSEDDFNRRYEDFLEVQHNLNPSILRKRQAEIEELLQRNRAFKIETERLLKQAEQYTFAPVRNKLNATLQEMGHESGYAFILNTDNNTMPYVNNAVGEDITNALITVLQ